MKLTKSYLQTLSTDDLLHLADTYGLFLSADMTRRLLIGELLDLNEELPEEEQDENSAEETAHDEVCSYSITEIRIVLKDPIWFFVFWNFHPALAASLMASKGFSHFFLRVYALSPENPAQSPDYFDIEIPAEDRTRYVHVSFDEYLHRIDLMASFSDNREQVLAQSNTIGMRRKNIPQRLCISQNNAGKILSLSGLADLKKSHFQHYRQAFL